MKKRAAGFIMALGVCSAFWAGCGNGMQTDEELVIPRQEDGQEQQDVSRENTGQEGAGQQGRAQDGQTLGNVAGQVQAPERYRKELSQDGVNLEIDAGLVIPDVPGIKTKTVTSRAFTQEDYDAVNRVLLGGGSLWDRDYEAMEQTNGFTLGELEEKIALLEKARDVDGVDGDAPYGDKEETLNVQLEQWKEKKAAAEAAGLEEPVIVEIPAIVNYDESRSTSESVDDSNWLGGYVTKDGEDYYVHLTNNLTSEWRMAEFAVEGMRKYGSYVSVFDSGEGKMQKK